MLRFRRWSMAERENFTVPSSDGHSRLFGTLWKPEGQPSMVLQIAHGMLEHMGCYDEFASWLADQGILVAGHDHLGHGRTAEDPSQLGVFAAKVPPSDRRCQLRDAKCAAAVSEKDGTVFLIRDLNRVRTVLSRRYVGIPYFMMGHSMGSFMLRRYLTAFGDGICGAVLMGTGNQPKAAVMAGLALAGGASALFGPRSRSSTVERAWKQAFNRRFCPLRTSMDWLSTDEEQVDRYLVDPLCNFQFSSSAYRDLLRMVYDSEDIRLARRIPKDLPILLVSGDQDPVGEEGRGVLRAEALLRRAGVRQVETKLYPGCRHELVIEKNRLQVAGDILAWMESCRTS